MSTKYKYILLAVDALGPGEGLKIKMPKPWGLATLIYRRYKAEDMHLRIDKVKSVLYIWRDPEWKVIDNG